MACVALTSPWFEAVVGDLFLRDKGQQLILYQPTQTSRCEVTHTIHIFSELLQWKCLAWQHCVCPCWWRAVRVFWWPGLNPVLWRRRLGRVLASSVRSVTTFLKPKKLKTKCLQPKLLIMFSQVDQAYEFCKWINPQQQECDFEWKRLKGNITRQRCQISDKVGEIESFS